MISPDEFIVYLSKAEGGSVAVDLAKIGQSSGKGSNNQNNQNAPAAKQPLRLALDMEDCLDRFYGGYYSDWACGGQWNRAYQFVQLLVVAFQKAQIELVAFFDGTLRENKRWTLARVETRERTLAVLKHIRMMGTPPPKVWWLPPSGLRTCLRNALRTLNIPVVQTVHDHSMEVMGYYQEHKLDGVLGLSPDYIVGNVRRFFSSHDLRLSYNGKLECKELLVGKFLTNFSLTPDHLPYVAALFGGYTLLTEVQLKKIYAKLNVTYLGETEARIKRIAEIVRNSPTSDLVEFIKQLELQEWEEELRETVEYYQRKGKFASNKLKVQSRKRVQIETAFGKGGAGGGASSNAKAGAKEKETKGSQQAAANLMDDVVALASETNENDEVARKILLDVNSLVDEEGDLDAIAIEAETTVPTTTNPPNTATKQSNNPSAAASRKGPKTNPTNFVYTLPSEILKTALLRHQRGMMDARIFHLFNKKEIILPQLLEDEQYREVPSVHLFYRPARQMIYAILFNLYHQRYMYVKSAKEKGSSSKSSGAGKPEILIKEWIWSPQNEYARPELVVAEQLPWSVSTIQRLWFGMAVDDKLRRMKAFLTVMRSDTPLMMNRTCVPQHMLVLACVLRYIITSPDRNVLSRSELDAFLATAFSPCLNNVEYTQAMVLPGVNLRGVYLATLLMEGFETASMANDACGVPLPWLTTNPWLVFDGKLFQLKLKMTGCVQSLHELCEDHLETVLKIERVKKAILEDAEHFLLPDPMAFRQMGGAGVGASATGVGMGGYGGWPMPLLQSVAAGGGLLGSGVSAGGSGGYYNNNGPLGGFPFGSGNHLKNQFVGAAVQSQKHHQNQQQQQLMRSAMTASAGLAGMPGAVGQGQQKGGHQLKVGGVVVGSWGSGYGRAPPQMAHLSTRYNQVGRGRNATQMLQNRLSRVQFNEIAQISQYPSPAYGPSALNRAALNVRGLGGMLSGGGGGGGYGVGGMLGKPMKVAAGKRGKGKQGNLKKQSSQQNNKKKNNKTKKDQSSAAAANGKSKDEVAELGEQIIKKLTMDDKEEGENDDENNCSSSRLLDSDLVTEMCDGVLKDDDEEEEAAAAAASDVNGNKGGIGDKAQPKHILTKKKLIAVVGSQEKSGDPVNGGGGGGVPTSSKITAKTGPV